jgi:hypothetical protein
MQITNANPTKKDNQSIVVQSLFLAAFAGRSAALTQGRTSPLCDLMFKKTYKVVDKYMMHIHIYIYSFIHLHIRMYIQKKDCAFSKCFASEYFVHIYILGHVYIYLMVFAYIYN